MILKYGLLDDNNENKERTNSVHIPRFQYLDNLNEAGKLLKDGFVLTFCYHNHGYEFSPYEDGTLMDYVIQNINPEYVSFEIDILWTFFPGADPAALINKYGNRFKLLHLKDLKKGISGNLSGSTSK